MLSKTYTYLALGDSYTIGEGVAINESFPYQTIQLLRKAGNSFNAPEIVARTGWTTDELKKAIRETHFQKSYHFVSLMIGVNDQYRGKTASEYAKNFEQLLLQAINFAANKTQHVFVLSIPDWGKTPFADGIDHEMVSNEIDAFNAECEKIAKQYRVQYISLSGDMKESFMDDSLLAADKLHPSGIEYSRWAYQLADGIQKLLL